MSNRVSCYTKPKACATRAKIVFKDMLKGLCCPAVSCRIMQEPALAAGSALLKTAGLKC